MTFVITVLVGAGTTLIASSLDDTPIATTLHKIINGETIDWSGTGTGGAGSTFSSKTPSTGSTTTV